MMSRLRTNSVLEDTECALSELRKALPFSVISEGRLVTCLDKIGMQMASQAVRALQGECVCLLMCFVMFIIVKQFCADHNGVV